MPQFPSPFCLCVLPRGAFQSSVFALPICPPERCKNPPELVQKSGNVVQKQVKFSPVFAPKTSENFTCFWCFCTTFPDIKPFFHLTGPRPPLQIHSWFGVLLGLFLTERVAPKPSEIFTEKVDFCTRTLVFGGVNFALKKLKFAPKMCENFTQNV